MGQRGVPKPLVLVVASGTDLNTTGQAVSALRRLASNGDNAVGMVRVSRDDALHQQSSLDLLRYQRCMSRAEVRIVLNIKRSSLSCSLLQWKHRIPSSAAFDQLRVLRRFHRYHYPIPLHLLSIPGCVRCMPSNLCSFVYITKYLAGWRFGRPEARLRGSGLRGKPERSRGAPLRPGGAVREQTAPGREWIGGAPHAHVPERRC